ncbi:uncharacterized protein [Panulirus ornatus]|uniref:uncharacterized protein n=1 Tax=Panulirus ornatus TaxID=150431 RepID=UPI003A836CCE
MFLTKQLVCMFVEELGHRLQEEEGSLRGARIRLHNNPTDILAGDARVDFDLILEPWEASIWSNLKIIPDLRLKSLQYKVWKPSRERADANMFHKKNKNKMANIRHRYRKKVFCSKKNKESKFRKKCMRGIFWNRTRNLKTLELRTQIFTRLEQLVEAITLPCVRVTIMGGPTAVHLVLHTDDGHSLLLSLHPLIVVRSWEECPGLVPLRTLPHCLQDYIATGCSCGSPIFYITPGALRPQHSYPRDVWNMVGCSSLEKHFLREERDVRAIVRFATSVMDHLHWTSKYGLRSFHFTRLAIKNAAALRNRTTRDGFKALLRFLDEELQRGGICDCFVSRCVIYRQTNPSKLAMLRCDLREAQRWKFEGSMTRGRREDAATKTIS